MTLSVRVEPGRDTRGGAPASVSRLRSKRTGWWWIAACLAFAAPAAAQEAQERPPVDRARVDAAVAASGFQGVYAVAVDGARVAGGAVGEAAPGEPFRYEAVFPWASVTKQAVAALVMRRVADGDVRLDAPASLYLPALRGTGPRSPTVRELLQHRAGLRRPAGHPESLGWCLAGRGAPGGQWAYNNCNYLVLGAMLERLGSRPLPELFAAEIAGPAGMDARFVVGPGDPRADGNWAGGPSDAERETIARYGAAGALVGTAEDMLAFDRALLTGAAVSERVRAEMWRGDPKLGFQALGQWSFDAPLRGCAAPVRLVERRGAIGRFQVRNVIAPDRGLALVMLTNRAEGTFDFGEVWQGRGPTHDVLAAALCP